MSKFSDYLEAISRINDLGNVSDSAKASKVQWLFQSGMLFSSQNKWWGDFGLRSSVHEGIDIAFYRTDQNKIFCFDDSIKVPAIDDGILLNICDDFLAKTLVIKCKDITSSDRQILFAYAHIFPGKKLKPGYNVKKNEVIARVCNTYKNPQLPSHLHCSCFEVPKNLQPEHLNWNLFSKSSDINLINPVFI
ncbi:MAG: hypothetical protein ABFR31_04725 [Thermodesulfobacteriota bacterium]